MKVNLRESVEIDCEVNVDLDDVIAECFAQMEQQDGTHWRQVAPVLNTAVKLLGAIKDVTIEAMPAATRQIVYDRLLEQAARYHRPAAQEDH